MIKGRKGTLIDSRVYGFIPYEVAKNTKQRKIKQITWNWIKIKWMSFIPLGDDDEEKTPFGIRRKIYVLGWTWNCCYSTILPLFDHFSISRYQFHMFQPNIDVLKTSLMPVLCCKCFSIWMIRYVTPSPFLILFSITSHHQ